MCRPPPSDTMGYDQEAGATHPTGMHSCSIYFLQFKLSFLISVVTLVTIVTICQFKQKQLHIFQFCCGYFYRYQFVGHAEHLFFFEIIPLLTEKIFFVSSKNSMSVIFCLHSLNTLPSFSGRNDDMRTYLKEEVQKLQTHTLSNYHHKR